MCLPFGYRIFPSWIVCLCLFAGFSKGLEFLPTPLQFKQLKTTNITSILNGQARLPCDISSPNLGERVILVLWFRLNSDTPIYSVDARDVEINRAGHWSAETAFGRRARFAWHETPSYLVVDGLVKEDKGVYRCRVDYRTSQTKNSLVNLTIIAEKLNGKQELDPMQCGVVEKSEGTLIMDRVVDPHQIGLGSKKSH
ncbi:hypothetical protein QYM36_002001 [Artemia franciscana]|uniref:Ig-like domain-containing protein n=1 Tax=Artemia franciscana TaxID=6661 RepID=A0AA88IKS5_ARTSF|nr:hypothetical protein QYM36_002001 [Artemia franciscana]